MEIGISNHNSFFLLIPPPDGDSKFHFTWRFCLNLWHHVAQPHFIDENAFRSFCVSQSMVYYRIEHYHHQTNVLYIYICWYQDHQIVVERKWEKGEPMIVRNGTTNLIFILCCGLSLFCTLSLVLTCSSLTHIILFL